MSELGEKLIEQALGLPANERAKFAERLLSSLDPELSEIDQLWAKEAEDRLDAYERGEIERFQPKRCSTKSRTGIVDAHSIPRRGPQRVIKSRLLLNAQG